MRVGELEVSARRVCEVAKRADLVVGAGERRAADRRTGEDAARDVAGDLSDVSGRGQGYRLIAAGRTGDQVAVERNVTCCSRRRWIGGTAGTVVGIGCAVR